MPDDHHSLFLQYYGEYLNAKERKSQLVTWWKTAQCRAQLQKIGKSPDNEEQICVAIFSAFVTKEKAEQILSRPLQRQQINSYKDWLQGLDHVRRALVDEDARTAVSSVWGSFWTRK